MAVAQSLQKLEKQAKMAGSKYTPDFQRLLKVKGPR